MLRKTLCTAVGSVLVWLTASTAGATAPSFVGTRSLGMGDTLRAAATGDAALNLNPSGMSLTRAYAIEGAVQHTRPDGGNVGRLSIVDSTSGFNLAGGVYYTYQRLNPEGVGQQSRHEGGLALSFPFGDLVYVGANGKYLRWSQDLNGEDRTTTGITFDAGLTVRPVQSLTVAVVGYNLRDLGDPRAPVALGFGAAFVPLPSLLIAADAHLDFTTTDDTRGNALSYMGGAEYVLVGRFAVRGGGGRDGLRERGYGALGFSYLSAVGALDLAARQELTGERRATVLGASARLFVP